jgi:hypothetical protein
MLCRFEKLTIKRKSREELFTNKGREGQGEKGGVIVKGREGQGENREIC